MQVIYVRQSVDKKDSISIETQIEICRGKIPSTNTEEVKVYSDKGFSGKSTDRPEFQNMMRELRKGQISKIIIYKLDRISRSLIDFLNMRLEFSKYNVELVSCMEDFDTSTSIGKLMLNMLMMFAEMERETIQKRIKDNYYARGEKGLYLGGHAPFGYRKIETQVNGKKTYTFAEDPEESEILRQMFEDYVSGVSLVEISKVLTENKVNTFRGNKWSANTVSRILKNPVYVKANAEVFNYLLSKGATLNNTIEDYCGENGCLTYGNTSERTGGKFANYNNYYVTIGLHKGIIEPSLWLAIQYTFDSKSNHSNLGTGSLTWLQGLIKCNCGYTYYVKKCSNKNKSYRYLYCRGRKNNSCPYPHTMLEAGKVEEIVESELLTYLHHLKDVSTAKIQKDNPEINVLKMSVAKIDEKINRLINQLSEGSEITAQYLNKSIEELHNEKRGLVDKISKIQLHENKVNEIDVDIDNVLDNWGSFELEKKKNIAKNIIDKIVIEDRSISIKFYEIDY